MDPVIVKYAPYITTTITDNVDAALSPPKNRPTNLCIEDNNNITDGSNGDLGYI